MTFWRSITAGAALALAFVSSSADAGEFRPIEVHSKPFSTFEVAGSTSRFGELEFRGGVVLSSRDKDFGALSGIAIGTDGKSLLAVADTGFWFTGTLVETKGRLTGLTGTAIAPILDSKGAPRGSKRVADAESLKLVQDKGRETAIVAFEQSREVSRFDAADLANAVARPVKLPEAARNLKGSRGFETLAVALGPGALKGGLVLVAERALDKNGNHRGWILNGPKAGAFSIRRIGDFDITDGDFLPNGDLVILERLFNLAQGVGMRIRRIPAADIAAGKTVDGPIVMAASLARHRIDNMEGLALRPEADGEISVFIVSDDNQSFLQQTLILKFAWRAPDTQ